MKTATASRHPGTEQEALIKEARRRQRRRYLTAGAAVVAVFGSAAGLLAGLYSSGSGHPGGSSHSHPGSPVPARHVPRGPAPIPHSVGTTVLMWPVGYPGFSSGGGPAAYVDDLNTGRLTQSWRVAVSAGDFQPLLARTGRWLVYVGNGTTAIKDDLSGKPHVLGRTPFFAPAAAAGHVWLFRIRHVRHGRFRIEARLVPVAGGPPGRAVTLPPRTFLPAVRGTDDGLLLQTRHGLALWKPGTAPRALPFSPGIDEGFDATSRAVAYGTGCRSNVTKANDGYETCTMLRILNVRTGKLTSFPAPSGTAGWVPNGFDLVSAISPGGRMIAAYAAARPQGQGKVRLYLMPVTGRSRRPTAVPSSSAHLFARTAWSAKGSWLLYQGPGRHLWAYQVTSGAVRASTTPCCQYTVMAAAPSQSG